MTHFFHLINNWFNFTKKIIHSTKYSFKEQMRYWPGLPTTTPVQDLMAGQKPPAPAFVKLLFELFSFSNFHPVNMRWHFTCAVHINQRLKEEGGFILNDCIYDIFTQGGSCWKLGTYIHTLPWPFWWLAGYHKTIFWNIYKKFGNRNPHTMEGWDNNPSRLNWNDGQLFVTMELQRSYFPNDAFWWFFLIWGTKELKK